MVGDVAHVGSLQCSLEDGNGVFLGGNIIETLGTASDR